MSAPERVYTPPEIAKLLRVSPDTVRGWIRSGELKASDLSATRGGRPSFRINEDSVRQFLALRSVSPPPKPTRRRKQRDIAITEYY